jgi:hypothetical protein
MPATDELTPSTWKLARALSSAILGLSEDEQGIPPNRSPHVLTVGRRAIAQLSRTPTHSELMGAEAILHHKLGLSTTQLDLARSVLHDLLPHHGAVARSRGVPLSGRLASLGPRRRSAESPRRSAPRPRGAGRPAVRGSSRRSSARSSDSNDDDGEPEPPGELAGRLCACGCGADISHKRADALTAGPSCRSRLARREQELASANARLSEPAAKLAPVTDDRLDAIFSLMVTDADGQYPCRPRRLSYASLDHLRTRLAPRAVGLPAEPRMCSQCGCHLRRGREGPVCDPCASAVVAS